MITVSKMESQIKIFRILTTISHYRSRLVNLINDRLILLNSLASSELQVWSELATRSREVIWKKDKLLDLGCLRDKLSVGFVDALLNVVNHFLIRDGFVSSLEI